MNVAIRYFSGTGNTEYIARLFQKNFTKETNKVDCQSIENPQSLSEGTDLLILGAPIYAGNVPEKFIRWALRNVPEAKQGTKAILFTTSAGLQNANGRFSLEKKLIKKGYQVWATRAFVMPRNYYFGAYGQTSNEDAQSQVLSAEEQVVKIVQDWEKEALPENAVYQKSILGLDLTAEFFSVLARPMGKSFSTDSNCIGCGKCVKNCPQENISIKNDKVHFGWNCMLCTRCIHQCPTQAISYKKQKYPQYQAPG